MAIISQTAANVGVGSLTATTRILQVGEAVTQGQPGYRSATDSKYYQADANDGAEKADVVCIFLTPASTNGYSLALIAPPSGAISNLVDLGATLAVGTAYYLSNTKGAIQLESDLVTNDWVTFLGIAKTTALLDFQPRATGVQKP